MEKLLGLFIGLKLAMLALEMWLRRLNRNYYLDQRRQEEAAGTLGIGAEDFAKMLSYSKAKYRFANYAAPLQLLGFLLFVALGGFGLLEQGALHLAADLGGGGILTGLLFFALLGGLSLLTSLPFDLYSQFVIEEKHGFNRQSLGGFFGDLLKSLLVSLLLGTPVLAAILWFMASSGSLWWLWVWVFITAFSIVAAWLFPTFIAPLFNKFTPLSEGSLKEAIFALAAKVKFKTSQVFIMDASRRSGHGNAYFTGLFGEKRIVLFDTLINKMSDQQVVAVLAHELGHFKLRHVFWGMIRGIVMSGLIFYGLSLCLPLQDFYHAFYFSGVSDFSALVVFSQWYGLLSFWLQPLQSAWSRKNEFAADRFAVETMAGSQDLRSALINLCESNQTMPLAHPLFSLVYYSHPPLLERITALDKSS